MKRKRLLTLLGSACLVLILAALPFMAACAKPAPAEEWPEQIVWGSFPKGSIDYGVNTALSVLISKYTPTRSILREAPGSIPILTLMKEGVIQLQNINGPDSYSFYHGLKPFEEEPVDFRVLAKTYELAVAFAVRPNEGIDTISDLEGKTVRTKSPTWWQNEITDSLLGYYKVNVEGVAGGHGMSLTGPMIDKEMDAIIDAMGTGSSLIIVEAVGLKWLPMSEEAAKYATSRVYGTEVYSIPDWMKEMYDMPLDEDFLVVGCPVFISTVPGRLADHNVYGILDAIFAPGHLDEVLETSKNLLVMNLERAVGDPDFFIPFHSGAVSYFKDRGVWTEEHEQRQKELLAKAKGS